ncbi:MAG: ABC transporter permease [Puniceicoccales bacterium]|jgi:phospholipid/cholesterol/gamma-HCH transport system permease protein|nr:ABC transporter permease [Puniceicoccales bacterium]
MWNFFRRFSTVRAGNPAEVVLSGGGGRFVLALGGEWRIGNGARVGGGLDALCEALRAGRGGAARCVLDFSCERLGSYDSSLPAFLLALERRCEAEAVRCNREGLPEPVQRLLALALARPARGVDAEGSGVDCALVPADAALFLKLGTWGYASARSWGRALDFLGQVVLALLRLVRGRARMRWRDCWFFIQTGGVDALPIVALISFLTGLILAYIGAIQLKQFGTTQYVAALVGLAMVREMGVLMAGIIQCARTATAYAAQLGAMQVSDEVAALRVLGISPVEYWVLPRILALVITLPLLTLYANLCGMLGGLVVVTTMDVTLEQYFNMTLRAINVPNFTSGLIKSVFFAALIAWAGCFRGMVCERSAQGIGTATTTAAVLAITLVIIADALFAVLFNLVNFY